MKGEIHTDKILERVLAAYPATRKVVLFGSRASGEHTPDSDYDLLVVVETDLPPAHRAAKLRLALRGLDASFDLLVMTPEEFEATVHWKSSIAHVAARNGRLLHDAA